MVTVFALTLIFSDGYLGGATHAQDFKSLNSCNKNGSQMAAQYTSWGHPASFNCVKITRKKNTETPVVIHHDFQALPGK